MQRQRGRCRRRRVVARLQQQRVDVGARQAGRQASRVSVVELNAARVQLGVGERVACRVLGGRAGVGGVGRVGRRRVVVVGHAVKLARNHV